MLEVEDILSFVSRFIIMMFILSLPALAIVAARFTCLLAHPAAAVHEVFETLEAVPAGWSIQDDILVDPLTSSA